MMNFGNSKPLATLPLLLGLTSCAQVLGLGDYKEGSGAGGGGGASGSTGPSSGTGTTSPTTTSSTSSSTGTGGMGPMPGDVLWAHGYGDPSKQEVTGVAVDPQGNIYVTGLMFGTMDVGGQLLSSGGEDLFVFSLDPSGGTRWAKSFRIAPAASVQIQSYGVAVDATGVVVAGIADATAGIDFGGGAKKGFFLAKLSTTGNLAWSIGCGGGPNYAVATAKAPLGSLSIDATSNIYVSASTDGAVKCDMASGFQRGNTAYQFNPDGTLHASFFEGSSGYTIQAIGDADPSGGYVMASHYPDHLKKLFTLTSNFDHPWPSPVELWGVSVDNSGRSTVVGNFTSTADFGGGVLTAMGTDMFVARYDGAGAHIGSQRFGNNATALAVDSDLAGNPIVAGSFVGHIDLGASSFDDTAGTTFLARFANDAKVLAAFQYQGIKPVKIHALPGNRLVFVGNLAQSLNFGAVPISAQGGGDVAVALLQL